MDFIYDYGIDSTESSASLPAPASHSALSSSNNYNTNNQSTKFPDFSKYANKESLKTQQATSAGNALAERFAKISIDLINQSEQEFQKQHHPETTSERTDILAEKLNKIIDNTSLMSNLSSYNDSFRYKESNDIKHSLQILESKNYLNLSTSNTTGTHRNNDSPENIDQDYSLVIEPGLLGSVSRRKLKVNIQNEALKENVISLKKFEPMFNSLVKLNEDITTLNKVNDELRSKLESLNSFNETNFRQNEKFNLGVLKQLKTEKDLILIKKNLLISFKNQFQLNEYEKFLLESSSNEITNDFFDSLEKAYKIYDKCSLLLSMNSPQIGLNIMQQMKTLIDKASNNMNFYINQKINLLNSLSREELQMLKKCIRSLINSVSRDDLAAASLGISKNLDNQENVSIAEIINSSKTLKDTVTNIIDIRSKFVTKEFDNIMLDSETRMYSTTHDPLRYMGDLLFSVHSIIVNEKEVLQFLLGLDDASGLKSQSKVSVPSSNDSDIAITINITELQNYFLDKIIGALASLLKLRYEQIFRSQADIPVIGQLYTTLDMYKLMFSKQFGAYGSHRKPLLIETLINLQSLLQERIFSILHNKQTSLTKSYASVNISDSDLQPPEWLIDYMESIHYILQALSNSSSSGSSLSETSNFMDLSDELMKKFIDLLLDNPIDLVKQQIENSNLGPDSASVVKINSLDFVSNKVFTVEVLNEKYENLLQSVMEETSALVGISYNCLLTETKLAIIEKALNQIHPIEEFSKKELQSNPSSGRTFTTAVDQAVNDNAASYAIYESAITNSKSSELFSTAALKDINDALQSFIPDALVHPTFFNLTQLASPTISNQIIETSALKFVNFYRLFYTLVVIYFNNSSAGTFPTNDSQERNEVLLSWNDIEIATLLGIGKLYMEQMTQNGNLDEKLDGSADLGGSIGDLDAGDGDSDVISEVDVDNDLLKNDITIDTLDE